MYIERRNAVMTTTTSTTTINSTIYLNPDYLLFLGSKPQEAIERDVSAVHKLRLNKQIGNLLFDLGISPHLKGFRYLRYAIEIAIEDFDSVDMITKILYPEVAKVYKTTAGAVERAIRTAISSTEPKLGHCSNKEFIFHVINLLSNE